MRRVNQDFAGRVSFPWTICESPTTWKSLIHSHPFMDGHLAGSTRLAVLLSARKNDLSINSRSKAGYELGDKATCGDPRA